MPTNNMSGKTAPKVVARIRAFSCDKTPLPISRSATLGEQTNVHNGSGPEAQSFFDRGDFLPFSTRPDGGHCWAVPFRYLAQPERETDRVQLPPERANEPAWLQVQRRVRREEHSWNYGAWAAIATAMLPYALLELFLSPADSGAALLAASVAFLVVAIVMLRRALKGTFMRGFAIWSVPLHALAVVTFAAMLMR